jgi:hypothetical protein
MRLLHQIKLCLSKRWVGPLIGLVGSLIGITVLVVSISTYVRQENWREEDRARVAPQLQLVIDPTQRSDGWRRAVLQVTNRLNASLTIQQIDAVEPAGLQLAQEYVYGPDTSIRYPLLPTVSTSLVVNKTIPAYVSPTGNHIWGGSLYFKLKTPNSTEIVLRVVMKEVDYPHQDWTRKASAQFTAQ